VERERQRQIGDDANAIAIKSLPDRPTGIGGPPASGRRFSEIRSKHRPCQKRAEQDDRAEIAIGKQMCCRPQLDAGQHRMFQRGVNSPADIGRDHQDNAGSISATVMCLNAVGGFQTSIHPVAR